ncbi:MAG: hypothetical protein NT045_04105 [Candidatus Aureabacteria bacterium]|nr:hypothetical protein [Candidatus Auribacterota bacterium]
MDKGKVYVIGSGQVILPFRAGGAVLCPVEDAGGVATALADIARQPRGSLVLITDDAAGLAPDEVRKFEECGAHAIMVIPTRVQEKSAALERMRELIIRSVGVDLIGKAPGAEIGKEISMEARE